MAVLASAAVKAVWAVWAVWADGAILAFRPGPSAFLGYSAAPPLPRENADDQYHLPSATAFANWPTPTTPLARVTNVSFNPGGEFMAMGNERGLVLLYSLKHYSRS